MLSSWFSSPRWTSPLPPPLPLPHARCYSAPLLPLTSAPSMTFTSWTPSARSSFRMCCTRRQFSGQAATLTHTQSHTYIITLIPALCGCVQADGGGPPPALGEEGLLPGPECSTAPGAGQRPLLAVVLSARHLRTAEAVGVSGSPGRPGSTALLV